MIKCKIKPEKRSKMKVSGTTAELTICTAIIIDQCYQAIMKKDPEAGKLFKSALVAFLLKPDSPLNNSKEEEDPHEKK